MANFHPEIDLLTEYAAGSLPLAQAACVSVHVQHCEHCQQLSSQLGEIGAALFGSLKPAEVGDDVLNSVLARLDEEPHCLTRRLKIPAARHLRYCSG